MVLNPINMTTEDGEYDVTQKLLYFKFKHITSYLIFPLLPVLFLLQRTGGNRSDIPVATPSCILRAMRCMALNVLLRNSLDNRLPPYAPHINIHEADVLCGTCHHRSRLCGVSTVSKRHQLDYKSSKLGKVNKGLTCVRRRHLIAALLHSKYASSSRQEWKESSQPTRSIAFSYSNCEVVRAEAVETMFSNYS